MIIAHYFLVSAKLKDRGTGEGMAIASNCDWGLDRKINGERSPLPRRALYRNLAPLSFDQ
jgi:hypothetical protein